MVPLPAASERMRRTGQSLIELTAGIVVLVPVLLFLADFALILWAVQSNDMICRDAARAAAAGDPLEAPARAQAVVNGEGDRHSSLVSNTVLVPPVDVSVTHEPVLQYDRLSRKEFGPGGPVYGTVTVATEVEIKPFVLKALTGRKFTFRANQTFPITYIAPVIHPPETPADPDGD
jgi:hypothetical protein